MGFFNFFGEKPVPNKLYTLEQAMKFMEKYGDMYDFPATEKDDEIGFMAVPKEQSVNHVSSLKIKQEDFRNRMSGNGKLKGINSTSNPSKRYEEGRKYGDYQKNSKKYQKWVNDQR